MNIFAMLKKDHDKVKELFKRFKMAEGQPLNPRRQIAEQIFRELEVHSRVEEEIFYPKLEKALDKPGAGLVQEAIEEHRLVKEMIEGLRKLTLDDVGFPAKFDALKESVLQHIDKEEGELFPQAKEILKESESEDTGKTQRGPENWVFSTR